jgi:hypothetical protein
MTTQSVDFVNAAFTNALANSHFYTGSDLSGESDGVAVDSEMFERCWSMSHKSPEIRACIEYLKYNILAKGIEMARGTVTTSPEFHSHMQEYYVKFCMDMIEYAVVIGVVPYILVKNGKNYGYPMVIKPGFGTIRVQYDDYGMIRYSYQSASGKSKKVFFEVFRDLGINGEVHSIVQSLIPAYEFLYAQEVNTFMANEMNCRPPVFLRMGSDAFSEKDVVNRDVYGAGVVAEQEFQSQMLRNRIQLNVVQAQKMYLQYMNSESSGGPEPVVFGAKRDRLSGLPFVNYKQATNYQPEFVPFPNDCQPTSGAQPRAPGELSAHREHFRTTVCTAFSVSNSVLSGQLSNVNTATASVLDNTIQTTFEYYKSKLTNVCLKTYRVLENDKSDDIKVLFPSLMNGSMYERLYKDGILTYSAYKEQLSKRLDISMNSFEKTPREPVETKPENKSSIHRNIT